MPRTVHLCNMEGGIFATIEPKAGDWNGLLNLIPDIFHIIFIRNICSAGFYLLQTCYLTCGESKPALKSLST